MITMDELYGVTEVKEVPFTLAQVIAVNKVLIQIMEHRTLLPCSVVMLIVTDRHEGAGLGDSYEYEVLTY